MPPQVALEQQTSGTSVLLQAVSAVSDSIVWVSGHGGTWARTLDGGRTWQTGRVAGEDSLQFRDVHAVSADSAWLLSAGTGAQSRIYRTTDGGASWLREFVNPEPRGFFDCMSFWDGRRGVVYGDQVGGRLTVLVTSDGGDTWSFVPPGALPAALGTEGGFAASGTCLVTRPGGHAWIATGNGTSSRVLHSADYGATWSVAEAPVPAGVAAGLATITFRDDQHGAALGGPIGSPDARSDNVVVTRDGGRSWRLAGRTPFSGAVYGAAYVPGAGGTLVAVSPKGAVLSRDDGMTWSNIDSLSYWGIGFSPGGSGWLAGPRGRIARVTIH
ncbi:MAG TPA: hypothetical protein VFU00_13545 [Gemmatimonadales bacterium]|nr:hypothetical protein [Gemmatimonadales bacterium]